MQLKPTTPGIPSSTVSVVGFTQAKYCVTNYAPTSRITVAAPAGITATIRTSNVGAGCTRLTIQSVCGSGADRAIVATGIGADGNPATSSATLPPTGDAATCTPTSATRHSSAGGVGLSHGVGLALLVVAAVVAVVVIAGAIAYRRRSSSD